MPLRWILILGLAALARWCAADLQADVDACIALHVPWAPGNIVIDKPLVFKPLPGDDNFSLVIKGNGHPQQWSYYGEGFPFEMDCPKGVTIENFNGWSHAGGGYHILSHGSAGRFFVSNSRVQAKTIAWFFEAIGGADISCLTMTGCDVEGAVIGFKVTGPNALNPQLYNCTFSNCQTAVDLTQGGSDANMTGGGFSHCAVGIDLNPGYQFQSQALAVEDCGIGLRLGSGTGSSVVFGVSDSRGTPILVQSATNGGNLIVDAGKCSGKIVTTGTTGYLGLSRKAALLKVTKPSDSTLMVQKSNVGFIPAK